MPCIIQGGSDTPDTHRELVVCEAIRFAARFEQVRENLGGSLLHGVHHGREVRLCVRVVDAQHLVHDLMSARLDVTALGGVAQRVLLPPRAVVVAHRKLRTRP